MRLNQRVYAIVVAAFVCGIVFAGRPASAQTQIQAGQVIISEFRLRGPAGAEDEFVELYNNTDAPITVQALDNSNGWSVIISNGQITGPIFTVPNGTVIPARGHLLGANVNGYSLCGYPSGNEFITVTGAAQAAEPCLSNQVGAPVTNAVAAAPFASTTPDRIWDFDVSDGSGVALFATTNGTNFTAATRLDAVGFTGSPALYKEGAGFPTVVTSGLEHTYYRDLRNGLPKDTGDNAADFLLVGTTTNLQITRLGAPGPENLASPVVNNATIAATLLDQAVSSSSPPNRGRTFTVEPNATFGTLFIRRTITNNTGQPVSRLRYRVVIITTLGTPASECPAPSCADLRALTSPDEPAIATSQGLVVVRGLRLEQPPEQSAGGGYNASLSDDKVTLGTPLLPGQSVNVVFKLGVMRNGPFRFFLNIEAQNGSSAILVNGPASGVGPGGGTDSVRRKLTVDTGLSAPGAVAAPASPVNVPTAAPPTVYVPWFINLTPPTPARPRPAGGERDREAKDKGDKGEEQKSEEEAPPPPTPPTPQAPDAPAPEATADPADAAATQKPPATKRRGASKKRPDAATPARRGEQ